MFELTRRLNPSANFLMLLSLEFKSRYDQKFTSDISRLEHMWLKQGIDSAQPTPNYETMKDTGIIILPIGLILINPRHFFNLLNEPILA